jgi:hypothetical protein
MTAALAGIAAVLAVMIAVIYAAVLASVVFWLRDEFRSWLRVRRMRRSGEPKRVVAPSWVVDEDGNVITSDGHSWTVTR